MSAEFSAANNHRRGILANSGGLFFKKYRPMSARSKDDQIAVFTATTSGTARGSRPTCVAGFEDQARSPERSPPPRPAHYILVTPGRQWREQHEYYLAAAAGLDDPPIVDPAQIMPDPRWFFLILKAILWDPKRQAKEGF